jgi:hypothetical protein
MMDVKAFAAERGLMGKDLISVVRTRYRGYGKSEHSKVANPEKYGIRLLESAEQLIKDTYGTSAPRRAENRRNPCRVQCRLSRHEYARLQLACVRSGHETMQEFLSQIITNHLNEGCEV